ncbi:HTH_Tnp_Tc3_2 domain-containing protein [Trichonephila clavipes]|nr:HTH_Tnp_Tc3_2 domain-containing protein [Trichonephila clavipes]
MEPPESYINRAHLGNPLQVQVTAATMPSYQDLSEFERGVIKLAHERWDIASPRIIKRDRRATLPQIAANFNAQPSKRVTVRTIQRNIIDMGFRSQRPTRVSLLTARPKALCLAWARQHRHWTVDDQKHVA